MANGKPDSFMALIRDFALKPIRNDDEHHTPRVDAGLFP
jgi:hypothetical protein